MDHEPLAGSEASARSLGKNTDSGSRAGDCQGSCGPSLTVALDQDATWSDVANVLERCGVSQAPLMSEGEVVGWVGDHERRLALRDGDRTGG